METVSGNPHALANQRNSVLECEVNTMKREDLRMVLYQLASQFVRSAFDSRDNCLHCKGNSRVISDSNTHRHSVHGKSMKLSQTEATLMESSDATAVMSNRGCTSDKLSDDEEDNFDFVSSNMDQSGRPNGMCAPDETDCMSPNKTKLQYDNLAMEGNDGEVLVDQEHLAGLQSDTGQNDDTRNISAGSPLYPGGNGYRGNINLLEIFKQSSNIAQLTSELQKNLLNVSNMNIHFDSYLDFAFALNRLCRFVLSIIERCSEDFDIMGDTKYHETSHNDYAIYEDDIVSQLGETSVKADSSSLRSQSTGIEVNQSASRTSRRTTRSTSREKSSQTDLLYQDYVNLLSVEDDVYEEIRLLKSEAEIVREENKDLCDINDALRSRIELISQNNDELLLNQDELLNEISRQREENQTLRNNFNRVLYDYNRLENEMQTLQFDYEDLNIEKELLVNRLSLKDQECKSLRDRHDTAVRKMKIMQEKFESIKNMHDEGKVMKRKDWEEWSKLRSQLSATENALQDVRRQKSKLIRELEQMRERLRRSHSEVSKADEAALKLEERLSRAKRCRDKEILLDRERSATNSHIDDTDDNRDKQVLSSYFSKVKMDAGNSDEDDRSFSRVKKVAPSNRVKSIIRALTSEGSDEYDESSSSCSPIDDNGDFLFLGVTDRASQDEPVNSNFTDTVDNDNIDHQKASEADSDESEDDPDHGSNNGEDTSEIPQTTEDDGHKMKPPAYRGEERGKRKPIRQSGVSSIRLDLYTLEESE